MKKIALSALFAAALLSSPVFAQSAAQAAKEPKAAKAAKAPKAAKADGTVYKLQPQLSTLGWLGKKVGGQHNGTIQFKDGDVLVKGNQIVGGTFVVDMNSMKNTDLTDAGYNAKLMGHLTSDDFFGVAKHPTATFKITNIAPIKGAAATANNATITGDLTVKGITSPITFPAKIGVNKDGLAAATGTATIDRTKYDVKYGSTLFGAAADKAIDNDFTMSFNVIAKK
ncbi:Polyisoprenoid-binding protein YceI [Hymenobacter daecheongensis DSM 21074]|uniref:Polyisoprenoid-binding protein YceI n=1 Tax=Hymenobacter daecheongensis DSM 21074 TaxID=1121955 RepID=A0A1M6LTM1_9BACT|nr:YceI family protein [Hymenobacter daecheongensis]SHJ74544.1 Polyisoprenoid-binding protein YceI [Hymenobacter daecheongensis DSM 21074]